jgi:processive 1,2-diacylglycerol beta-glucosyltransferase
MKILLVHASAGAGHMMAAKSVFDGLKAHTDHDVVLVDALDKTYPAFKKMYRDGYAFMIKKIPLIWAVAFGFLDIPIVYPLFKAIRRVYNAINTGNFAKYLVEEQFDCIITCHFMPVEVASALKRKDLIKSKLITCVTDFDVHRIWLGAGVDLYTVACDFTKKKLMGMGVAEEKVAVTGIPTNEKFTQEHNVSELKQKLGVKENVFTALMATGSFGIGPIEDIIKAVEGELQIIVVSGHNKALYATLQEKSYTGVIVMGLVDNMHELMAVSDVMITKPGGLSTSEALVSELPLIFFSPIPGQEINNIKVLAQHGVGIKGDTIEKIVDALKLYRSSKDAFVDALQKTRVVARPNAVKDIIAKIQ